MLVATRALATPAALPAPMIAQTVLEHYGIEARIEPLPGERDDNFKVEPTSGPAFVLKVAAALESAANIDLPIAALLHLESVDPDLPCPRVCRSVSGNSKIHFADEAGNIHTAYLRTYLRAVPLQRSRRSQRQAFECGLLAARLT
jgi:hydroxylysine kinase